MRGADLLGQAVSIHAPRFREAMLENALRSAALMAVSIHAPRFREAMPREVVVRRVCKAVSIHAPRFREAMRSATFHAVAVD